MPELPDVEGFRRYFNRFAAGARVERIEVLDRSILRNTTPQGLGRALRGHRFGEARRRGKWLIAEAEGPILLLHFGMTGLLAWSGDGETPHRHDRIVLHLPDGNLAYRNMRKFGGVWLASDPEQAEREMGSLGPDARELGQDEFVELLTRRRRGVKALLMDQKAIAGVGNLLSDEVLWRARIHPRRSTASLSRQKKLALYDALLTTIRAANRRGRIPTEAGWLTGVRDAPGDCPRCGRRLRRGTAAGRTACWCPKCQRRP